MEGNQRRRAIVQTAGSLAASWAISSWAASRVTEQWLPWGAMGGALYLLGRWLHSPSGQEFRRRAATRSLSKGLRPEDEAFLREAQRKLLAIGLDMGGGLIWNIRTSALETIKSKDLIERSQGTDREQAVERFSAEAEERWKELHREINDWERSTGDLIETMYGSNERALFESEAAVPIQDAPRFDQTKANYEANLHSDVQKNLYRLHQIIERHATDR